jgi:proteasome ATPase
VDEKNQNGEFGNPAIGLAAKPAVMPHYGGGGNGFEIDNDPNGENPADPQAEQLAAMNEAIEKLSAVVTEQQDQINQLCAVPLEHCTVFSIDHKVIPERFELNDRVALIDAEHEAYQAVGGVSPQGSVVGLFNAEDGTIEVEFPGFMQLVNRRFNLKIGVGEDKSQIRLLIKNDGSNVVVTKGDGTRMEVWNPEGFNPKPGDTAKVNMKTNQIMEIAPAVGLGALMKVASKVVDGNCQVDNCNGQGTTLVRCNLELPEGESVEIGDSLVISGGVAVKHISDKENQRFKIKEELKIDWADVGGVETAKAQLQEAIELPAMHPEIFEFYKQRPPAGILLYGPPGCGKTLLGKAAATSLAKVHNKESFTTGFNYVKGPEMLDKWVGNSEKAVRELFARGRRHYEEYGYPCLTFVDEADSILQERTAESQKWENSMVAAWLAEMDGLESSHQIVILATNRPKALDGAVVREGRIDRHVKVPRPDKNNAGTIFKIHLKNVPLHAITLDDVAQLAVDDLWENDRPLYTIEHDGQKQVFSLNNCLSGAMIAGIINEAKSVALLRDLKAGKVAAPVGVTAEDIKTSIENAYVRHRDLNHHFDLLDFYDTNGYDEKKVKATKIAMG